jgi:ATP-dependent DNA helicase RecQ
VRLLDRGFSLEESAAIRGIELSAIVRHATLMARNGRRVAIDGYLSPRTLYEWDERRRSGQVTPPAIEDDPLGLWDLFLACRGGNVQ